MSRSSILDPSWLPFLLRYIDGYPAVILSPVVVLFADELAPRIGIIPRNLRLFTGSIGVYGLVSLVGLRNRHVPPWLAVTGVAVNVAAFVTAARSLTSNVLTPVGRMCHVSFLVATAFVTFGLAGSAPGYYKSGSAAFLGSS